MVSKSQSTPELDYHQQNVILRTAVAVQRDWCTATWLSGSVRLVCSSPWPSFLRCILNPLDSWRSCCLHTCRAPTSGGQYHWVSMLAPRSSRKFLSFLTGWLTATGWQASVASGGYLSGTLIQGMIVLNNSQYNPQRWQGTLLLWAVIIVAVLINTVISSLLPMLEGIILIVHVLGFFAIVIPLVYTSSHGSASTVFTSFINEGGWTSQGLSFWVGIIGNVFAFLGECPSSRIQNN